MSAFTGGAFYVLLRPAALSGTYEDPEKPTRTYGVLEIVASLATASTRTLVHPQTGSNTSVRQGVLLGTFTTNGSGIITAVSNALKELLDPDFDVRSTRPVVTLTDADFSLVGGAQVANVTHGSNQRVQAPSCIHLNGLQNLQVLALIPVGAYFLPNIVDNDDLTSVQLQLAAFKSDPGYDNIADPLQIVVVF